MSYSHSILNQIKDDLRIKSYTGEAKIKYLSRVIYAAISMWIRIKTLDEDMFQDSHKVGVSKKYILDNCKPFLENMLDIYPELYDWFYPKDSKNNPIMIIRDRLQNGGELVNVGYNTDLALPRYDECPITNDISMVRGIKKGDFCEMTGIAQYTRNNEKKTITVEKILEFYGLTYKNSVEVLKDYMRNIKWRQLTDTSVNIFNKYVNCPLSSSWDNKYKLRNNDISLYNYGLNDFGFIKKESDTYYISQANKGLIDMHEVRRFMYGLKADIGNAVVGTYVEYSNDGLVQLTLYNDLPKRERNVLLFFGWPINNINDRYNLLFTLKVWELVKIILGNLNMELREAK